MRAACCVILLLLCASDAAAQHADADADDPWAPVDRGEERHDGFVFRIAIGPGLGDFTERSSVATVSVGGGEADGTTALAQQERSVSGAGLMLSLDLGSALTDTLSAHLRLSQLSLPEPALRIDGQPAPERGDSTRNPSILGGALTYYLMPLNAYATAAAGVAILRRPRYDGDTSLGDAGVGLNLDLGKEWWVSDNWGVGASARWFWLTIDGPRGASGHGGGVLLSATYQ